MSITASIWLIILAALVAANLPFINQRFGVIGPVASGRKSLWIRLLEMLVLYLLVGGLGLLLERRAGQISPQGWEFYAVTGTLFLTLAFPGFVYRYLVHRKG
ncbi:DUF2818 family protein [Comamonas sp. Y33R10-2]|uniref:DUF2818 family protein n=1 Tax=Comamonas sp. Y33R10-2 TaxID=2853257 RepID=UPI001C5C8C54|nr:DUF2818 family protein [Comamonas sp. Y33R10-2]QXZ10175.1 DUF2818 family protein [Comamonas sp. Y33R10-2]